MMRTRPKCWKGRALWMAFSSLLLLTGCGSDAPNGAEGAAADSSAAAMAATPQTVEDIFPETGSRGLVFNRCSSCHALACAAIGQRTEEDWAAVEAAHVDYNPGMSIEDRGKIFDYLKRHFTDRQPEPAVPPHLLGDGCPQMEP